jgi:hypothetical protein
MFKKKKSTLFDALEKKIVSQPTTHIDCTVVDGMFFFHLLGELPLLYGRVSLAIFQKLCRLRSKRIDIVFDTPISPSIKDLERDRRSMHNQSSAFTITGPLQQRPSDFIGALRNNQFKESLVAFLVENGNDDSLAPILEDKVLYVTKGPICYSYRREDGKIVRVEETGLASNHEEADSRMMVHISSLKSPSNVVVRSADTDVMAILLGNIHKLSPGISVWLEAGIQSKNNLRYIEINALASKLGPHLSRSIPGFHAFTGCDYTPSFANKGKIRPLALLEKNVTWQTCFSSLGESQTVDDATFNILESFTCLMYGKKNISSVNEARLDSFLKTYQPKKDNPMAKVRGVDGSALPPCRDVLRQQVLQTNFVCSIWNNANKGKLVQYPPEQNGWILEDGKYSLRWFDGDMVPSTLEEIITQDEETQEDETQDDENVQLESESESEEDD